MTFSYVALGDSLSVGIGSSLFAPGFVQRYKRYIEGELEQQISLLVFARPGFETGDVLKELENDYIQKNIKESEILTITAGGNDLINATRKFQYEGDENVFLEALAACQTNYSNMLRKINDIKKDCDHHFIIRIPNLYNPFPDFPLATKWVSKFNLHIKKSEKYSRVRVADIYNAFFSHEQEYLSFDRVHPNDRGYEVIAKSIKNLGIDSLRKN
ncbi:GDSL-type esterase/lipase family protein [Paenisporosarcina sp. TG-14]|uniref:GDSL-type esterase/lipase family protein n=1 Tax=Paenisporosarcina sp. TG-14 TaxID=1231057 RepID=UPI0002E19280|nr:GDSL-type esterase/lipase family protein [Paenisporosarcina sp. TG-14]